MSERITYLGTTTCEADVSPVFVTMNLGQSFAAQFDPGVCEPN